MGTTFWYLLMAFVHAALSVAVKLDQNARTAVDRYPLLGPSVLDVLGRRSTIAIIALTGAAHLTLLASRRLRPWALPAVLAGYGALVALAIASMMVAHHGAA